VVLPDVEDFKSRPSEVRLGLHVAWSLWHLHDWLWHEQNHGADNHNNPNYENSKNELIRKCLNWVGSEIWLTLPSTEDWAAPACKLNKKQTYPDAVALEVTTNVEDITSVVSPTDQLNPGGQQRSAQLFAPSFLPSCLTLLMQRQTFTCRADTVD
jgi:hypothetical protein